MNKTELAVSRQVAAMGVGLFEVGLYKPDASCAGQAAMIPRTWDAETTRRSIPWLRLQNAEGRNIYIRPKGEHGLSLIDDLSADSVRRMKEEGFQPALIVQTSPGNFQAWLKHPRSLPHDVSTAAARTLAKQFGGDLGAADWRHFGRLAGFTNRKPSRALGNGLFPFVRLIEASSLPYANGEQFVSRIEAQLRQERDRLRSLYAHPRAAGPLRTIDSFRANPAYAGDGTRIDLAYAIYALAHGRTDAEVESAIRSRDLSHKGTEKRQAEYVERTIRKARAIFSREEQGQSR